MILVVDTFLSLSTLSAQRATAAVDGPDQTSIIYSTVLAPTRSSSMHTPTYTYIHLMRILPPRGYSAGTSYERTLVVVLSSST